MANLPDARKYAGLSDCRYNNIALRSRFVDSLLLWLSTRKNVIASRGAESDSLDGLFDHPYYPALSKSWW